MPNVVEYFELPGPPPGETIEIEPGVHWLGMPLPFRLNHINLWLLEDGEGWTLVDTGIHNNITIALWKKILSEKLDDRPILRVLCTHYHPDHVGMAGWIYGKFNIGLWMTEKEWLWARSWSLDTDPAIYDQQGTFLHTTGCSPELLEAAYKESPRYHTLVSPIPRAFSRLCDEDAVTIGDRDWQIVTGSGHAPEHACLYCGEFGLLLSGDQVLPKITPIIAVKINEPDANPLDDFLASIEKLRVIPDGVKILPSHNKPFSGLYARLDALRRHHDKRLNQFLDTCVRPMTAKELSDAVFPQGLDPQNVVFAIGETVAHLNYLCRHGSIVRETRDNGVYLYAHR